MARSWLTSANLHLLLVAIARAAPLSSANDAFVLEKRGDEICKATSSCTPFTIEASWGSVDPTGSGSRRAILTNGLFPGPTLRVQVGECVDFKVINNLDVGTGIHFHGIQQTGTPWSDGVPGLSQYPIQPGDTYMYKWTADEQGAYFYHSHYKGQITDGLYGAIFITPANNQERPLSTIDPSAVEKLKLAEAKNEPIFISDWSKYTFDQFINIERAGNVDIACADALILNGMGSQYCLSRDQINRMSPPQITNLTAGAGYTDKGCLPANTPTTQGNYTRNLAAIPADVFDVCTPSSNENYTLVVDPADGYTAITFVNAGAFSLLKATIAAHKMWVYNYNGRYVTPQQVDQINVANGERVSVMVKLDQQLGDYSIQISNLGLNQVISGFGVLKYKDSGASSVVSSSLVNLAGKAVTNTTNVVSFDPAKAAPFPAEQVSRTADRTFLFRLQKLPNSSDAYIWSLQGNTTYAMSNDDSAPLLYKDPATMPETDIVKKTNYGEWVDIILQTTGPIAQPHPIHKHGNKFFVVGQGRGSFNWSSVVEAYAFNPSMFNFIDPPFVDGYTTLAGENTSTWMVFRYRVETPGAWFLHCHMQSHFSGGMAIAILDGVDKWPTIPADAGKVCQGSFSSDGKNGDNDSDRESGSREDGVGVVFNNSSTGNFPTNAVTANDPVASADSGRDTNDTSLTQTYTSAASSSRGSLLTILAFTVITLSV